MDAASSLNRARRRKTPEDQRIGVDEDDSETREAGVSYVVVASTARLVSGRNARNPGHHLMTVLESSLRIGRPFTSRCL